MYWDNWYVTNHLWTMFKINLKYFFFKTFHEKIVRLKNDTRHLLSALICCRGSRCVNIRTLGPMSAPPSPDHRRTVKNINAANKNWIFLHISSRGEVLQCIISERNIKAFKAAGTSLRSYCGRISSRHRSLLSALAKLYRFSTLVWGVIKHFWILQKV